MKKGLFLFLIPLLFANCKKEKLVNQFGEWELEIYREITYDDTTKQTIKITEKTSIEFYDDYSGLYKGKIIRWLVYDTKDKIVIYDCNPIDHLTFSPPYTILVDEKDHQVWESNTRIWVDSTPISEANLFEKWELNEK